MENNTLPLVIVHIYNSNLNIFQFCKYSLPTLPSELVASKVLHLLQFSDSYLSTPLAVQ